MRWCPWRSVILTWLAASTVMEMAQRHQSYSLQWDQLSTWPLRLSMPGLASPSLMIRDATCGVSALFCKYLYFNGPYRSMIFFAVKLCVHCYAKKYKHWLLNWACTVWSLSWFFSPTVWACTCLLLSFKCRSLFLCLTPIPFSLDDALCLEKQLVGALSWSSRSFLFEQVHHAVWLPTILWPMWGGVRLEPWGSLSGLPGDAFQPHPGWSLLLPFLGVELHLFICQGSDPTLVGAWASQTLLSSWCFEAHLGLQPASCHSPGYTPHPHQVRKASVFACVCFVHLACKQGFLVYCKSI